MYKRKLLERILLIIAILGALLFIFVIAVPSAHGEEKKPPVNREDWSEDEWLLAQIIFREAGNQDCIGQLAVAQVVINRIECEKMYPDTVRGVCLQRHQFTPTDNKRRFLRTVPTLKELIHARAALNDYFREKAGLPRIMPKVVPDNVMYFAGRDRRNHFYWMDGKWRRHYIRIERGECDYCKALEAVQTLDLVKQ